MLPSSPHPWFTALALIKFDFDQGQLVQQIYPPSTFTPLQQKSIAMLSFPDSNAFDTNEGILKYIFRMKKQAGSQGEKRLFGFVCFKQKKDEKVFRGYFQKSLVVISQYPLVGFFGMLAEFLVFRLFGEKEEREGKQEKEKQGKQENQKQQQASNTKRSFQLQEIWHQSLLWPSPQPFLPLTLPLLNYTFTPTLPTFTPEHTSTHYKTHKILNLSNLHQTGYFQQTSLLSPFKHNLPLLWTLYELILLNKPLLIIGDSPTTVSNAVLATISLISPLQYVADYKPYMTVYDDDCLVLQTALAANPEKLNTVIGVTNPLFLKTLRKFPNILSLTSLHESKGLQPQRIRPDPQFLQLIRDMLTSKETEDAVVEGMIRRHFRKLTEMFMEQFEVYFLGQKNVSGEVMQDLKRYKKEEFLKFVKGEKVEMGGCFEGRREVIKLYAEFCESLNFHRFILGRNVIKTF